MVNKINSMKGKNYLFLFSFPVFFVLVFFYFPLLGLFIESIKDGGVYNLSNYQRIFQSDLYINVFLNSLKISLTVSFISLLLSYPVAYFLLSLRKSLYNLLIYIVILPFWTSILVRSFAWQIILQKTGIINSTLLSAGLINAPYPLLYNFFSVVTGMVYIFIPYMVLILFSNFKSLNLDLMMVSQTLGANKVVSFIKVFLPLSLKAIVIGFIFVFLVSLGYFITPALLGGAKETMISMIIDIQINRLLDWGFGAALSFSLLFVIMLVIFILNKFIDYGIYNRKTFD